MKRIEIRGTAFEMTETAALEHLDGLAELHIGKPPFFGEYVPAELKQSEIPVLCKSRANHVVILYARMPNEANPQ